MQIDASIIVAIITLVGVIYSNLTQLKKKDLEELRIEVKSFKDEYTDTQYEFAKWQGVTEERLKNLEKEK